MSTPTDPFEELDRELREKVAGDFRRTAEEDEFTARKAALRKRDLPLVAYELLSRGDTVRAMIGTSSLRGVITHARGTLATMTAADGTAVHLNLDGPIVIDVVEKSATGGKARDQFGPESFVARLRELELNEVEVEVVVGFGSENPVGTIEAVGVDHVMLGVENPTFVPLTWIAAVHAL